MSVSYLHMNPWKWEGAGRLDDSVGVLSPWGCHHVGCLAAASLRGRNSAPVQRQPQWLTRQEWKKKQVEERKAESDSGSWLSQELPSCPTARYQGHCTKWKISWLPQRLGQSLLGPYCPIISPNSGFVLVFPISSLYHMPCLGPSNSLPHIEAFFELPSFNVTFTLEVVSQIF